MQQKNFFIKNKNIRIISGKWRGRKIFVSNHMSVRPTTSCIRETLFNWINPIISSTICLDCFAGSGALGLESLSRGAKKVTFIDQNYVCIEALTQTVQSFQVQKHNIDIVHSDCRYWLRQSSNAYDIIFIDPPFQNHTIISEVILLLEKHNHFSEQSWIYIEASRHQKSIFNIQYLFNSWSLLRKKTTKSIAYCLYFRGK